MRTTFVLAAMAFVGCGGATSIKDTGPLADASSDSSIQTDAVAHDEPSAMTQDAPLPQDGGVAPGRNPACPAAVPVAGGPCKPVLSCDYGSDAHHICTTRVDCASSDGTNFKWFVSVPPDGCGANSASCPVSFTALAEGAPCPGVSPSCNYPEGRCGCRPCTAEAGASSMWACRKWGPTEDGCPADPPLSGDACSTLNQQCSYGGFCRFSVGPSVICEDGYWRQGGPNGACIIPTCGMP